jgi:hypothetical protein
MPQTRLTLASVLRGGLHRPTFLPESEFRKLKRAATWRVDSTQRIAWAGLLVAVAIWFLTFYAWDQVRPNSGVVERGVRWFVALAISGRVYWALAWRRYDREFRRQLAERELCTECGYDLRATSDRCPECGAVKGAE